MDDVPSAMKISISLKTHPSDGAVFFKVDGQRFNQTRTIKLLIGAKYKVAVLIKPGTVRTRAMLIGDCEVPLEEGARDLTQVTYAGYFDTAALTATKSGERQPTAVSIRLEDIGTFEAVWQCKFYNYPKRDHCQWGNSFAAIDYECKPNDTRTLLWVNKEVFR
ncbi:CB1 cannabinoid receptor-interacting protein 1 [Lethenteron reissneri]|uniref:CB1 cannabinoid receptor-interacting protein 1 n=1 Tax=Lethenteron reissneri TaxID=7753 RepID=UPI002AB5F229|nr:CB1 cannabinoid receptor-interacting protein 1 [Lethenteron reissneri]